MRADRNIRYANYQNEEQMTNYYQIEALAVL